jgi:hypothetical protein
MVVEAFIFCRNERLLQLFRNLINGERVATLFTEFGNKAPIGRKNSHRRLEAKLFEALHIRQFGRDTPDEKP